MNVGTIRSPTDQKLSIYQWISLWTPRCIILFRWLSQSDEALFIAGTSFSYKRLPNSWNAFRLHFQVLLLFLSLEAWLQISVKITLNLSLFIYLSFQSCWAKGSPQLRTKIQGCEFIPRPWHARNFSTPQKDYQRTLRHGYRNLQWPKT